MTTFGVNAFGVGTGRERFTTMVDLAREAEEIGCTAVWTSELYSRSATVPMAMLAAGTDAISIGTNIAYGVGRSPLMWAAEARDLDELSGGRIILGLGNGTPKMMEAWHGVSGEAPAARMAELVTVLKQLWRLHGAGRPRRTVLSDPYPADLRCSRAGAARDPDLGCGRQQADVAHCRAACRWARRPPHVHGRLCPRPGRRGIVERRRARWTSPIRHHDHGDPYVRYRRRHRQGSPPGGVRHRAIRRIAGLRQTIRTARMEC